MDQHFLFWRKISIKMVKCFCCDLEKLHKFNIPNLMGYIYHLQTQSYSFVATGHDSVYRTGHDGVERTADTILTDLVWIEDHKYHVLIYSSQQISFPSESLKDSLTCVLLCLHLNGMFKDCA